jgi:subtilase family serine protease
VPVADLAVVSVDAPAAAWSGQAVTLDWLVTNVGSQPTSAASWTDRVYLSTDETLSGDDLQVLQVNHVGALGAGGSYQQHVSITLSDSAVGPYYVFVVADALGGVSDSNLSNNTGHDAQAMVVSQTPPPDLVVTSLQAPAEAWSGQGLTLQWTVTNSGAGGTPTDRWTDSVVLSTDDVLGNGDDVALGSFAHYGVLAAGTGYTQSQTVALPSNAGGAWHVFVVTDAGNRVTETAEGNNSAGQPVLVHVSPSPDLRVTLVQADPASVQSGSATTLTWTVLNDSSAATPGGYW